MARKKKTPLDHAIAAFGDQKEIARILDRGESTISMAKKNGGKFSSRNQKVLLDYAKKNKIQLTAAQLIG